MFYNGQLRTKSKQRFAERTDRADCDDGAHKYGARDGDVITAIKTQAPDRCEQYHRREIRDSFRHDHRRCGRDGDLATLLKQRGLENFTNLHRRERHRQARKKDNGAFAHRDPDVDRMKQALPSVRANEVV